MKQAGRAAPWRQGLALTLLLGLLAAAVTTAGRGRLERADFVLNNGAELQSLDPAAVSGVPEGRVLRSIYEGLCVLHPRTLEPIPGVAERWEVSEDGRRYTFHLRPEARWSDGTAVTAEDFAFSWRRLLHPETAAEYAYQLWYVRGARQYSFLVDELLYAPSLTHSTWVEPQEGGQRVRVGLTGFQLEECPLLDRPRVSVAVGDELEEGDAFVDVASWHYHVPLDGRVVAVNEALTRSVAELLDDPYEDGWMIELELGDGALEHALAEDALLPGERFRREWIEEMKLGIRARDEHTLEVELTDPTPFFLALTAYYPLFPVSPRGIAAARERWPDSWELEWLRPENLVCNGPYRVQWRRVNDRIRLVRNELYWDDDNVALDTIDVLAVDRLGTSLNLYLTGEVDFIDRPITNVVPRLMPREDYNPAPYLGSYFYRVNVTRPPFDDVRIRRALALSIDRRAICDNVTKSGEAPAWTLVPPVLPGYPLARMAGAEAALAETPEEYEAASARDLERARELIAEAGFGAGGAELPTIEIHYNTDETHKDIAEVIGDGWRRHLGLEVKLLNQEWKVYLDSQRNLDYDVSRAAWIGDYPDANTFSDMFLTGGENNRTGWGDPRYDALVRGAASEPDPEKRIAMLAEAESILLEELPILPIYYYVTRNLVNPRLGGFHENFQDVHFPKFLYWMDDEELAAKRAAGPGDVIRADSSGPPEGKYSAAQRRERGR